MGQRPIEALPDIPSDHPLFRLDTLVTEILDWVPGTSRRIIRMVILQMAYGVNCDYRFLDYLAHNTLWRRFADPGSEYACPERVSEYIARRERVFAHPEYRAAFDRLLERATTEGLQTDTRLSWDARVFPGTELAGAPASPTPTPHGGTLAEPIVEPGHDRFPLKQYPDLRWAYIAGMLHIFLVVTVILIQQANADGLGTALVLMFLSWIATFAFGVTAMIRYTMGPAVWIYVPVWLSLLSVWIASWLR